MQLVANKIATSARIVECRLNSVGEKCELPHFSVNRCSNATVVRYLILDRYIILHYFMIKAIHKLKCGFQLVDNDSSNELFCNCQCYKSSSIKS
jgi:hypothetical protein